MGLLRGSAPRAARTCAAIAMKMWTRTTGRRALARLATWGAPPASLTPAPLETRPQIGEDLAAAHEVRASKSATNAVAAASAEGSAINLFNQPGMRDTEEAKLFMRKKTRQMLKSAGVPVGPSHAKSRTPAELPAAVPGYKATSAAAVYAMITEEVAETQTERPQPPPAAAPLGLAPSPVPPAVVPL